MAKLKPDPLYIVMEITNGLIGQMRLTDDIAMATEFAVACIKENDPSDSEEEIREHLSIHGCHFEGDYVCYIEEVNESDWIPDVINPLEVDTQV